MTKPTKSQIVASSSGWVAALLNFTPGLGTGYLYQRRWKAYWTTTLISAIWIYFDFIRESSIDPSDPASPDTGNTVIIGLLVISLATACEAAIKVKSERHKESLEAPSSNKK